MYLFSGNVRCVSHPWILLDHFIAELIYVYLQYLGWLVGFPSSGYFHQVQLYLLQIIGQQCSIFHMLVDKVSNIICDTVEVSWTLQPAHL